MNTWFAVAAGGALGSMARHAVNRAINQATLSGWAPAGVFVINIAGSILIGVLSGLFASGRVDLSASWRVFLVVGVLGGFTTFSAFTLDNLTLVQSGHYGQAAANAAGQVVLGLAGAWLGFAAAHIGVRPPI